MFNLNGSLTIVLIGEIQLPSLGSLWLAWNSAGLVQVGWTEAELRTGFGLLPPAPLVQRSEVPRVYGTVLRQYAAGDARDPASLPVVLSGTAFQKRCWQALRSIPLGQVRSYGAIAAAVGSPGAARAVGTACAINRLPIAVPCHRVVGASMRLGGYSGGLERKIALLEREGVRVDRSKHPYQLEVEAQ
jgi:O-6-methylguanine DNA methyltransferase